MIEWLLSILFPLLLMLVLYLFFIIYSPSFEEIEMRRREVGLLLLGSLSTMFLNFPIFIYKNYFLAMNIGGALIPIVLSFYLMKENNISFYKMLAGVSLVAFATYMITRVTSAGVIAYFPFYLLPSILASLIASLLYFLSPVSSAYSYSISTLGVLIGGDFSHLPEIFQHPFAGSMGGAGLYDMVYLAGLLSFIISFIFVKKSRRDRKEIILKRIDKEILLAEKFVENKKILLGIEEDYRMLKEEYDIKKARKIANNIIKKIGRALKNCYADEGERIVAFIIDMLIISCFSLVSALLHFFGSFIYSFIISFLAYQFLYFTLLEYLFKTTIGKAFFDMEIRNEQFKKADFMDSFTRNAIRFLDMFALFYIFSIILIIISPKKQRIGDLIAGTILVREKCMQ
ncbi:MAG: DUF1614 domain-containing protein [Thermoplasmata archaeon]|nr:DUF1614 domain-containing protein [Thermoplasmata archaeon]